MSNNNNSNIIASAWSNLISNVGNAVNGVNSSNNVCETNWKLIQWNNVNQSGYSTMCIPKSASACTNGTVHATNHDNDKDFPITIERVCRLPESSTQCPNGFIRRGKICEKESNPMSPNETYLEWREHNNNNFDPNQDHAIVNDFQRMQKNQCRKDQFTNDNENDALERCNLDPECNSIYRKNPNSSIYLCNLDLSYTLTDMSTNGSNIRIKTRNQNEITGNS